MSFDWGSLMTRWSRELLEAGEDFVHIEPDARNAGWLGYPGASEEQVQAAEARLGIGLPASYREFLAYTDGWRTTGTFIDQIWPAERVDWFRVRNQDWIDAYSGRNSTGRAASNDYSENQDPIDFNDLHLRTALEVSDRGDDAIYLLNPETVTAEGEWEAWFFANWLPGARRYRTFAELMQGEYESFKELRDDN